MAFSERNRQILTMVSLLGVLLTAGGIYYYIVVAKPQITATNKATEAAKVKVAEAKREITRITELKNDTAKREELERFVARAKLRLPTSAQEATEQGFYDIIEESLRRTGASFSRLAAKPPIPRQLYFEVPYDLKGAARYHEFGQLLNVIECNPQRLMRVSTFALKNDPKRPSIHPMDLTVKTFTFNEIAVRR
jgi:Tfp pilus assembly protein PilO